MASEDLLSYAEAQRVAREFGAVTTTNGTLLAAAVTGVSRALAAKCGPIVQETITDERHDGGNRTVWLRHWPVTSITSVTEYDGATSTTLTAETAGTIPPAGYYPDPYGPSTAAYSGRIRRRTSGYDDDFAEGAGNVVVSYVAGRFASTGAVTEDFKAAARMTLENWMQQYREGTGMQGDYDVPVSAFPRFAVPQAAMQLLGDEVHERDDGSDVLVG